MNSLKILHTSDWHLGQKLLHREREEEHQLALDWLLETIIKKEVDVLLVAGDVFDISNPPNVARRMYYQFLNRLIQTPCRYLVITGGNHDSPSMLEAPRELLKTFNYWVLGATPEDRKDQLIEIRDEDGQLEAVIAAVPFLRDRDLSYGQTGEGGLDRLERIRAGLVNHYDELADLIRDQYPEEVPIIATGHLYADGAEASDKQDNIYIGDKENIKADQFSEIFDYVALGHIHRPQKVGGQSRIRYSGSLIPLSFSETKDDKGVYILELEGKNLKEVRFEALPVFRRLKTIQGSLEEVKKKLQAFEAKERGLTPWVEVIVETEQLIPRLDLHLRDFVKEMDLELLKIRVQHQYQSLSEQMKMTDLDTLEVMDVFKKKCESFGTSPEDADELETTFRELMNWFEEREDLS
jgi:exonuclease SbcD